MLIEHAVPLDGVLSIPIGYGELRRVGKRVEKRVKERRTKRKGGEISVAEKK